MFIKTGLKLYCLKIFNQHLTTSLFSRLEIVQLSTLIKIQIRLASQIKNQFRHLFILQSNSHSGKRDKIFLIPLSNI